MKNKLILFAISLSIFSLNSCSKPIENRNKNSKEKEFNIKDSKIIKDISLSDFKGVYLDYDSLSSDHDFGGIKITDFKTEESILLVDNKYYNANPIWSPDGQQILFASARIGDLNRLRLIKKSARKQLYLYNLKNSQIVKFFDPGNTSNSDIVNFIGLTWNSSTNDIYFSNNNTLYSLSVYDKKINIIKKLSKECQITDLSLSSDKNYLVIEYWTLPQLEFGLYILDIKTNELIV